MSPIIPLIFIWEGTGWNLCKIWPRSHDPTRLWAAIVSKRRKISFEKLCIRQWLNYIHAIPKVWCSLVHSLENTYVGVCPPWTDEKKLLNHQLLGHKFPDCLEIWQAGALWDPGDRWGILKIYFRWNSRWRTAGRSAKASVFDHTQISAAIVSRWSKICELKQGPFALMNVFVVPTFGLVQSRLLWGSVGRHWNNRKNDAKSSISQRAVPDCVDIWYADALYECTCPQAAVAALWVHRARAVI